jgi:hypothetical protein
VAVGNSVCPGAAKDAPARAMAMRPPESTTALTEILPRIRSPATTRETLAAASLECERAAAFQKRIEIAIPTWQSTPTTKQIARWGCRWFMYMMVCRTRATVYVQQYQNAPVALAPEST